MEILKRKMVNIKIESNIKIQNENFEKLRLKIK